MLDFAHKGSGFVLAANACWVWMGDNANNITAACAIIGLIVNIGCSYAKYRRGAK